MIALIIADLQKFGTKTLERSTFQLAKKRTIRSVVFEQYIVDTAGSVINYGLDFTDPAVVHVKKDPENCSIL